MFYKTVLVSAITLLFANQAMGGTIPVQERGILIATDACLSTPIPPRSLISFIETNLSFCSLQSRPATVPTTATTRKDPAASSTAVHLTAPTSSQAVSYPHGARC
jgi:hypothetical protein